MLDSLECITMHIQSKLEVGEQPAEYSRSQISPGNDTAVWKRDYLVTCWTAGWILDAFDDRLIAFVSMFRYTV